MLPVAPATASSASTNGTPARKVTPSVRAKRAIAELRTMSPITGIFSAMRSRKWANFGERFLPTTMPTMLPTMMPITMYQEFCMNSEASTRNCVGAGNCAPASWKVLANTGTTNSSMIRMTMNTTASTIIG